MVEEDDQSRGLRTDQPDAWNGSQEGLPDPPRPLDRTAGRTLRPGPKVIGALVTFLLVVGWIGILAAGRRASTPATGRSPADTGRVVGAKGSAADAAAAIVNITTYTTEGSRPRRTPAPSPSPEKLEGGTGMILTPSGEVLTNNHVVLGSTSIKVEIAGRPGMYSATVVGVDPSDDVALIQLHGVSGLPTVKLADPRSARVGEHLLALGNSLGGGGTPTVSAGRIVHLHQSIPVGIESIVYEHLKDLIQTDAETSPGDSGGALVNSAGEVVGMITAGGVIASFSYAIPSNDALKIVNEIRAGHESSTILIGERGFLGVLAVWVSSATIHSLGLKGTSGGLVVHVERGSPADHAGIAPKAVIKAVDGHALNSASKLQAAVYGHSPGDRIRVTWVDRHGTHNATVQFSSGPAV